MLCYLGQFILLGIDNGSEILMVLHIFDVCVDCGETNDFAPLGNQVLIEDAFCEKKESQKVDLDNVREVMVLFPGKDSGIVDHHIQLDIQGPDIIDELQNGGVA